MLPIIALAYKCTAIHIFPPLFFQTKCSLTVTKEGNYTCIASNVAGTETITIDTRNLPTSGLKFHVESREIEILETPSGFLFVMALLALLGYYFRVDSLKDLHKPLNPL